MRPMMMIIRKYIIALLLLIPVIASAQTDRDYIRQGNKAYKAKQYPESEVRYRKALSINHENPQALYNLGCALMMQNKMSEAVKFFHKAASTEKNKFRKSKSYHNIGVICQGSKMYPEAIKAYSESLRNNPSDNETRYNLVLCKKLQKDNKQNDKNKQQNQSDKNKDKGNKDKQEKQKDKHQKQDKPQQNQPQMSKDNAEQLLNAAMQQERETQERLNRSRQQQQTRRLEKNW